MAEPKTADAQYTIGGENPLVNDEIHRTITEEHWEGKPTEEESSTLRKVAGKIDWQIYVLCFVEFCERGSYYSATGVISNFVNRKLPANGNGYGAPPRGTQQTAGALGKGTVVATAVSQSFKMLVYCLPVLFGWIADKYTGRYKQIVWGIYVCGIAHVLMIASGAKSLLASGQAIVPFMLSLYILAIGAAMFKPNVSALLLDQVKDKKPTVTTLETGERVIIDPESTAERVVLWFYLLINVGGFLQVPTSYTEKYVGWWLTFLLPLILYLPLPVVLWWVEKRLTLYPPGGSDLGNCFKVLGICLRKNFTKIGRHGFWEAAKPSNMAGDSTAVAWNDQFVEDVRRTFQATGMFCFFPIQYINDNGLGIAADALTTMLVTNGVPNDLLYNMNSLSIIVIAPLLNYGLYPFFRKHHIRFGPVARITFGLFLSAVGGVGYTVLNYKAYQLGPCGKYGSSSTCVDENDVSLVAPITIWWIALPYAIGGISELFVNVPAYGIAYSRAPKNMRGLVSALNLFNTGIAYALGLAFASLVTDPYLTWVFGAPAIIGFVMAALFWYLFHHIDNEEYTLSANDSWAEAQVRNTSSSNVSNEVHDDEKRVRVG